MDIDYATGDKKCNLPNAGSKAGEYSMLQSRLLLKLQLSSDRLDGILEQLAKSERITANDFRLIENLVVEAIRLRDLQCISATKAAIEALPKELPVLPVR